MPTATYAIRARVDTGVMLRLLGLLAQRDLVPDGVAVRRQGQSLTITIVQSGVTEPTAAIIAAKMRAIVPVSSAEMTYRPLP